MESPTLLGWNAILAADQLDPSLVTQPWLTINKIVNEDEFGTGFMTSEAMAHVAAKKFSIFFTQQAIQFLPNVGVDNEGEVISEKINAIVAATPRAPFKALGFNFIWIVGLGEEDMGAASKRLFGVRADAPVLQFFNVPDARFGTYLSKDFHKMRFKLDVKPAMIEKKGAAPEDKLQFVFNLQRDLTVGHEAEEIKESLGIWDMAKAESRKIIVASLGGGTE